jgi:regulator of sirC expression with transglutaminase-like and TPR domain
MECRLDQFSALLCRENFSLAEACLLIAQDAYPDLDVAQYVARIDALASTVKSRLSSDAFAEQKVMVLNRYLFNDLGFCGNDGDYYDPRNSYLNQVLERRTGIPITLSILYMEVGRRLGLRFEGVSFPGHFLVKLRVSSCSTHSPGRRSPSVCASAWRSSALRKAEQAQLDQYLVRDPRQIIASSAQSEEHHTQTGKLDQALAVMHRMLLVMPGRPGAWDRGWCTSSSGFRPALSDL